MDVSPDFIFFGIGDQEISDRILISGRENQDHNIKASRYRG